MRREKSASRRRVVTRVDWGESIRSAVSERRRRRGGEMGSWSCGWEGWVGEEGSGAGADWSMEGLKDIPGSSVDGDSLDGDVDWELGRTPDS